MGEILAKQVTDPQGDIRLVPEYDACREKAAALNLPLRAVYDRVISLDREEVRLYKTDEKDS